MLPVVKSRPRAAALAFLFAVSSCASVPRSATVRLEPSGRIEDFVPQWQELYPGLDIAAGRIERPRMEFWAARADLAAKDIEIVVNDGGAAGVIPAVTVSGFAEKYGCAAAMNAGPFSPVSARTGEDRTLTGVFVSNGVPVSPPNPRYDCLLFYDDGRAAVLSQGGLAGTSRPTGVRHALGGFYALLKDGLLTERSAANTKTRHPRSAAGAGAGGFTLYLLVIDGRRIGSVGATERETALLLTALGASDGILMDGGGSSALALYTDGAVRLANRPAHGGIAGRERAVATCVGIRAPPQ
jgi:exopolysaccharide biosynthesis protein